MSILDSGSGDEGGRSRAWGTAGRKGAKRPKKDPGGAAVSPLPSSHQQRVHSQTRLQRPSTVLQQRGLRVKVGLRDNSLSVCLCPTVNFHAVGSCARKFIPMHATHTNKNANSQAHQRIHTHAPPLNTHTHTHTHMYVYRWVWTEVPPATH